MNVLVAIGAAAAFIYSLYGTLTNQAANYMFYETTATIITRNAKRQQTSGDHQTLVHRQFLPGQ